VRRAGDVLATSVGMRTWILLISLVLATSTARAESYLDKKDSDTIGVIERALAKVDKKPALFDGARIPASADLAQVGYFYDLLDEQLDSARRQFAELSAKGAARPEAQRLRTRYDDLERYRAAFEPVVKRARTDHDNAARAQQASDDKAHREADQLCTAFHDDIDKRLDDLTRMNTMVELAEGREFFWQDAKEGDAYRAALDRTAQLCARLPGAAEACGRVDNHSTVTKYCVTAAKADQLMKQGPRNMVAYHAKNSGPSQTPEALAKDEGWIEMEGVSTWQEFFSGASRRKQLSKLIDPIVAQAKLSPEETESLWAPFAASYAQVEAKARELAPTWKLVGSACSGAGCAEAKKTVASWYTGATIKRFLQSEPGWTILTNDFGTPTSRERTGFALVQVKGDPFCQLRMWSLNQKYAGGGRYSSKSDVHLHYVRWQSCK
jgi:hypothetical protein